MRRWAAVCFAAMLLAGSGAGDATELPEASSPGDVGLSADRLGRIQSFLQDEVKAGSIPGAVLLVGRHGKVAYLTSVGKQDPASDAPMSPDTIFRLYSMSKPITSVAAMTLVEDGRISLDDPVSKFIPAFKDMKVESGKPGDGSSETVPARRPITVQDLLRHTSGITYGFFGDLPAKKAYLSAGVTKGDFDNREFADRIAALPLAFQPGTTWDYSHSTDVLGRVVEVASGQSLLAYEKARILDPLGMGDTSFTVPEPERRSRLAEPFPSDRVFGAEASFSDPRQPNRFQSGGGGMVGTTRDYGRFLQMLLNGGSLDGQRVLGPRTVALMTADSIGAGSGVEPGPYYLPGPGYGFGLGFAVRRGEGVAPYPGSPGDYFWGGVGGTAFWVDPEEDMYVVFMMQSPKQRLRYRPILRDMVYAAIER